MIAIKAENLGKQYKIPTTQERQDTLRDQISNSFKSMFTRSAFSGNRKEIVWALRNVNVSINQGDALGIIGRNGSGKSTLLKILSRITVPTEGQVKIFGKTASILEVGTGFHPELTGRENIFLYGAIMGMKQRKK